MKNENLHNLYGLSRELKLPVKWLKTEALAGRIPCLKIGRHLRFNKTAVENALAELAAKGDTDE